MMKPIRINKALFVIFLVSIINAIIWIVWKGPCLFEDSNSYIIAWDSIQNGKLDIFRTPVYPFLIGINKFLFGNEFLITTICCQHLFFLVSVYCFYEISITLFNQRRISYVLTFIYGVFPYLVSWNNSILTESLAISGSVIFLFLAIRLYKKFSLSNLLGFVLSFILLLLLRPAFIYFLPVFIVALSYLFFIKKTKTAIWGLFGTLLVFLGLVAYMLEYKREYGIFSSSNVRIINQYHIARENGWLTPDCFENEELRNMYAEYYQRNGSQPQVFSVIWDEADEICRNAPLPSIQKAVNKASKQSGALFFDSLYLRTKNAMKEPILVSSTSRIGGILGFTIGTIMVFLFCFCCFLVYWVYNSRKIPWITSILFMIGVSSLFVIIVGAQGDWGRLVVPTMPIYLLMVGQVCSLFQLKTSIPLN